jgi:uncharacterized membrane protein YsdA (DUF1294 family)/cold shock CspA family protein
MRHAGRISGWNEDKGYGFVVPHDGGDRAFVHIKAFQFGSRRPVDGDLISYSTSRDSRGRINALEARFAGQKIEARRIPAAIPRMAIGVAALLSVVAGTVCGLVPVVMTAAYILLSCLSYVTYALDKAAAGRGGQRTPEATLHLLDLLGGWPGALIAQQQFRHKTVKISFQSAFLATVFVNIAVMSWLAHGGWRTLATALST